MSERGECRVCGLPLSDHTPKAVRQCLMEAGIRREPEKAKP